MCRGLQCFLKSHSGSNTVSEGIVVNACVFPANPSHGILFSLIFYFWMLQHGFGCCPFNTPTIEHESGINDHVWNIEPFRDLTNAEYFTTNFKPSQIVLVPVLFGPRCPPNISRLVVSVSVRPSVDGVFLTWSWTNVFDEGYRVVYPRLVHFYPSVCDFVLTAWSMRPIFDSSPDEIFGSSGKPVNVKMIVYVNSAGIVDLVLAHGIDGLSSSAGLPVQAGTRRASFLQRISA